MINKSKIVFFIVAAVIVTFAFSALFGIDYNFGDRRDIFIKSIADIRWGIDIRGGVDAIFTPPEDQENITHEQMEAAEELIKLRLLNLRVTDSEVYTDFNQHRIIVRFPWKSDEADFDPEAAIKELGETALLTFREGMETTEDGLPTGITESTIILEGADITNAEAGVSQESGKGGYVVYLTLSNDGAVKFSEATRRLAAETNGIISIWMDEMMISWPTVENHITGNSAVITGGAEGFSADDAQALANKINSGSLPFKLETSSYSTIPPALGENALQAMLIAGIISFIFIAIFMTFIYRLPGAVSAISMLGHIAGSMAAISGFLWVFDSFTLTLPGIAGIILGIGMGVDANIVTFARIKEEIINGKSVSGAIDIGYTRGFTAVFDGNMTVIIVAIILMGAFGPPSSMFAQILNPIFFMFGPSTAGAIYSFGFTLIVGVLMNFIFSILASKLMIKSLSNFKAFQNPRLYGGNKK